MGVALVAIAIHALNQNVMGGTWTTLAHTAPEPINTMLLLPDGSVMAAGANSETGWYRLTPDSSGSFANGTWSTLASMNYTRLYFSSDVLTNGRVLVAGSEYGSGTNSAEIFDPVANTWTTTPPPPAGQNLFYDSVSKILPNGNVLVAPVNPATYGGTAIYNSALNIWSVGPTLFRGYYQDEASWVKLPDDSILTIDPFGTNSERYIPSLNQWVNDANVPVSVYDPYGSEMGAAFLLPDGRAFYLGATGNTAIYTPSGNTSPGSWQAGPVLPNSTATPDAPAAMMVNGNILCAVSPLPTSANHFPSPTSFYEYDPVLNSFTQVNGPTGSTLSSAPYVMRMLDLPDGSVLFSTSSSQLYVYRPTGAPLAAGKPTINSITANIDGSYHLTGTLLNGISEGAAYGDDAQMDSNYPLVRMTNTLSGIVYYARTFNWNCTSVMTGSRVVATEFALPAALPVGNYNLVAVANGIASDPVAFSTSLAPMSLTGPASVIENAGALTNAGTIFLNAALPTNIVVSLTSSVPTRLTVSPVVTIIAGQTSAKFDFSPVDNSAQDGNQTVILTASAPGFTNVTLSTLVVDDEVPPTILTQPTNQTITVAGTASFSITASGKSPLGYFWKRNGAIIPGANSANYSTNNMQLSDSTAQFSCVVSNAYGITNSAIAVLTVQPPTLVQNGGFEAGSFANWTQSGNTAFTSVISGNSSFVHSGTFGAELGPSGSLGFISQTVTTTPGQPYLLSFWVSNPSSSSTPNQFVANWNGSPVYNQTNAPTLTWTNLQFIVSATGSSTVLQFGFRNDPAYLGLDDISLTTVPPAIFSSLAKTNNTVSFSWSAMSNLHYQVQFKTNLTQTSWINLGNLITATNAVATASDSSGTDTQRFYRLIVLP